MAPFGIRSNVVGPGATQTENADARGPEAQVRRAEPIPLRRVGFPADIAGAVAFLVSGDASCVTGQVIYVDRGMLSQLRPPRIDRPLPPSVQSRIWQARPEAKPLRSWK